MKRPLIPIVICYALGLLAAHYEILALRSVLFLCGLSFLLFLAAVIAGKRIPATILALALFLLLGFIMLYPEPQQHSCNHRYREICRQPAGKCGRCYRQHAGCHGRAHQAVCHGYPHT